MASVLIAVAPVAGLDRAFVILALFARAADRHLIPRIARDAAGGIGVGTATATTAGRNRAATSCVRRERIAASSAVAII